MDENYLSRNVSPRLCERLSATAIGPPIQWVKIVRRVGYICVRVMEHSLPKT